MGSYAPSALRWLGLGKETVAGTAVAPTFFVPFNEFSANDIPNTVDDTGIRGTLAGDVFGVYQTTKQSETSIGGMVYPDSIGLLLLAMLGTDTVTGSTLKTHTFKSVTTTQPPSLTVSPHDPTTPNMRQLAYSVMAELGFKWAESAALEYSCKLNGKASVVGSTATPTISQIAPILTWQFTASINGVSNINLVAFEINFKRPVAVKFHANNSQDPSIIMAGPLSVTGKMTFEKNGDTELNLALNNTQGAIVLDSTAAATQNGIMFTLTKAALKNPQVSGKDLVEVDFDFTGIYNATDGGVAQVALCNTTSSY